MRSLIPDSKVYIQAIYIIYTETMTGVKEKIQRFLQIATARRLVGVKIRKSVVRQLLFEAGVLSPSTQDKYIRLMLDLGILERTFDNYYIIVPEEEVKE